MPERVALMDIDGVLADSAIPVVDEVNRRYKTNLKPGEIDHWNWVSRTISGITNSAKEGKRAECLWFDPETLAKSPPIEGSVEGVEQLINLGWKVWAATSRLANAREKTLEWIDEHFPLIGRDRVYMRYPDTENLISSAEVKLLAVGMLRASLYVEDDPASVSFVVENIGRRLLVAMPDRGWNETDSKMDKYRVKDWKEIVDKVRDRK